LIIFILSFIAPESVSERLNHELNELGEMDILIICIYFFFEKHIKFVTNNVYIYFNIDLNQDDDDLTF
jgi:hypothetical protein